MRRLLLVIFLLGVGFAIGVSYREIRAEVDSKRHSHKRKTAYATQPVLQDKAFAVIIYGEGRECLLSALNQDYSNFRVICIGGVEEDFKGKVNYTGAEESVEGLYRAIHGCRSDEIVILLRGEERLAHTDILKNLNRYFADTDVWMATGQEIRLNSYEKKSSVDYFHAFYAGLFQHIKLQDFLVEGRFKEGNYEEIIMGPLSDLCGEHTYFIPEPLVVSPLKKDHVYEEGEYARLKENPWHDFIEDEERIDTVVFSCNRPLQLYAFLESHEKYVQNVHRQFVIYRAGNEHYEKGYQEVRDRFPDVTFIRQSIENPSGEFSSLVQKMVFDRNISTAKFVAFAVDDSMIKDQIDLNRAAKHLKRTGAHGFYFRLGENLTSHADAFQIPLQEGVNAWQFSQGREEWATPNSVNMVLYHKESIQPDFLCMRFHDPNILEALWNEHADLSEVGLYSSQSKVVDLPLNMVIAGVEGARISTKELLAFFNQGLKMDITPLEEVDNATIAIEFNPEFTER